MVDKAEGRKSSSQSALAAALQEATNALAVSSQTQPNLNHLISSIRSASVLLGIGDSSPPASHSNVLHTLARSLVAQLAQHASTILPVLMILIKLVHEKVVQTLSSEVGTEERFAQGEERHGLEWEALLGDALRGLVGFLEEIDLWENKRRLQAKEMIGKHFAVLRNILQVPNISIMLKRRVLEILNLASAKSEANKKSLVDDKVLGSAVLGEIIGIAEDFVLMEKAVDLAWRLGHYINANVSDGGRQRKRWEEKLFTQKHYGPNTLKVLQQWQAMGSVKSFDDGAPTFLMMLAKLHPSSCKSVWALTLCANGVTMHSEWRSNTPESPYASEVWFNRTSFTARIITASDRPATNLEEDDETFEQLLEVEYSAIDNVQLSQLDSAPNVHYARIILFRPPQLDAKDLPPNPTPSGTDEIIINLRSDDVGHFRTILEKRLISITTPSRFESSLPTPERSVNKPKALPFSNRNPLPVVPEYSLHQDSQSLRRASERRLGTSPSEMLDQGRAPEKSEDDEHFQREPSEEERQPEQVKPASNNSSSAADKAKHLPAVAQKPTRPAPPPPLKSGPARNLRARPPPVQQRNASPSSRRASTPISSAESSHDEFFAPPPAKKSKPNLESTKPLPQSKKIEQAEDDDGGNLSDDSPHGPSGAFSLEPTKPRKSPGYGKRVTGVATAGHELSKVSKENAGESSAGETLPAPKTRGRKKKDAVDPESTFAVAKSKAVKENAPTRRGKRTQKEASPSPHLSEGEAERERAKAEQAREDAEAARLAKEAAEKLEAKEKARIEAEATKKKAKEAREKKAQEEERRKRDADAERAKAEMKKKAEEGLRRKAEEESMKRAEDERALKLEEEKKAEALRAKLEEERFRQKEEEDRVNAAKEAERLRVEQEKSESERADRDRKERERVEKERLKVEQERLKVEKERLRLEKEREESERLAREQLERDRILQERQRLVKEKEEAQAKLAQERAEKERLEGERLALEEATRLAEVRKLKKETAQTLERDPTRKRAGEDLAPAKVAKKTKPNKENTVVLAPNSDLASPLPARQPAVATDTGSEDGGSDLDEDDEQEVALQKLLYKKLSKLPKSAAAALMAACFEESDHDEDDKEVERQDHQVAPVTGPKQARKNPPAPENPKEINKSKMRDVSTKSTNPLKITSPSNPSKAPSFLLSPQTHLKSRNSTVVSSGEDDELKRVMQELTAVVLQNHHARKDTVSNAFNSSKAILDARVRELANQFSQQTENIVRGAKEAFERAAVEERKQLRQALSEAEASSRESIAAVRKAMSKT